ncbi:MAG TPA: thioesterase family protein [Nevskiaceae bacterium]
MAQPFRYRLRVRYGECDPQQVVFNARYADYVDVALIEFMHAVGWGPKALVARGLDMQVVKLTLEWRAAARFDDVVEVRVETLSVGNSSLRLAFDMRRLSDETALCQAEGVYVMVSAGALAKARVPDDVRESFEAGAPGALCDQSGSRAG